MPNVPSAELEFLLGRVHVGTPDTVILRDLARRMKRGRRGAWPKAVRKRCYAEALKIHHRNQTLYARVMRGSL